MTRATQSARALPPALWAALLATGIFLSITVVPSVFTIDDHNYLVNALAIRDGHVTVSNTAGLTPSRELLAFDPIPWSRAVVSTPVASAAPPLYGVIAWPFVWLGWRGLVGLNTLAYLGTAFLVFAYTRRYSSESTTPWLAAGAFGLGGWSIEYAQGLWPHMLSVLLCTGAVLSVGRVLDGGRTSFAGLAGLLIGLAAGVRYQNAVVIAALATALLFWAPRRARGLVAFLLAVTLPLAASSAINKVRLDSWNPISKGPGYLAAGISPAPRDWIRDPAVMLWGRVVDYTARPPMRGPDFDSWLKYDESTGAHLMNGETIKKAVLQSSPWAVLGLVMLLMAWWPAASLAPPRRLQLQLLSLVVAFVLGAFSLAGVGRDDSLAYNQRYLLELLPMLAIAFAWAMDGLRVARSAVWTGLTIGIAVAAAGLAFTHATYDPLDPLWRARVGVTMKWPLLLSLTIAISWTVTRVANRAQSLTVSLAAICLAWSLAVHVGQDVLSAQVLRSAALSRTHELARVLPSQAAIVAFWGIKSIAAPLLFGRDLVIVDARADDGQDAGRLIRELLPHRRVFIIGAGFPPELLERIATDLSLTPVPSPLQISEVTAVR